MHFKDNIECNSIGKEINESINRKPIEKKIYENQSWFFKKVK